MPTYDYECTECGYTFEYFQSMNDDPLEKCPECGGKVKRLIGGGLGIIFKGSGFYVTDNKKGSVSSSGKKKSASAPAEKGKADNSKSEKPSSSDTVKKEKVAT